MHDGIIIVCTDIIAIRDVLIEIMLAAGRDFIPVDGDKGIAVLTAVLMPQSDRMADLMDGAASGAPPGQGDKLLAPLAAYPGAAPVTGSERDIVRVLCGVRIRSENETKPCVGFPMGNGIGDPGLVGKAVVNGVRDKAVRPSVLIPGDDDTMGDLAPDFLIANLRSAFYFLNGAKDDVALKNR